MRVFLRSKRTRLYYASPSGWADSAGQALQFTSVSEAARFALDHSLPDTELVLAFYTFPEQIAMPLVPEWSNIDRPGPAPT
jgi:hypothetical protein